jgi:hypothetical protein
MDKHKADPYPELASPRRRKSGYLLTAIFVSLGLICVVLFVGPVLLAMAVVSALANMSAAFGILFWTNIVVFVMPRLIELLLLLQTGQPVRFVVRLVQTLCN